MVNYGALRRSKGWSLEQAAIKLFISRQHLDRVEKGTREGSPALRVKLARLYKMETEEGMQAPKLSRDIYFLLLSGEPQVHWSLNKALAALEAHIENNFGMVHFTNGLYVLSGDLCMIELIGPDDIEDWADSIKQIALHDDSIKDYLRDIHKNT